MNDMSYGILTSGNLGAECLSNLIKQQKINFVFTDKNSLDIINLCKKNNIQTFIGNPRNGKASSFIENFTTDVILSINYLFIVEKDILDHPRKLGINFHGSLLPKYRGRTPHVWAIINNEKQTGITAHLLSENCDEGDIIYQEIIPISETITGAEILLQFRKKFPLIVSKVIALIDSNSIQRIKQNESQSTCFGKRTPDDGLINWHWQKERIRNWVRAQAKPYPGAFTYLNNKKIIINEIVYSDYGFRDTDENGLVLNGDGNFIIKTPNGAVCIIDCIIPDGTHIEKGQLLK